jgi:nitronate monooxygenase
MTSQALIETPLTERFGLRLPIVAAPMAGVADGRFALAASRAGVLGTFGVGGTASADWIREQVVVAAEAGLPYGVGLMAWAQGSRPEQLDAVLAARPALVSMSFGEPERYVGRLREAGIAVATQVGSVEQALRAEASGVDFVVARGAEGGGHGYNIVGTLPLLQAVLEQVDVPVIAGGGIGTARGLAAVLAAGAVGAWVGTAFLTCQESAFGDDVVARLAAADEASTGYGHVFDVASNVGWPDDIGGRALRNAFFEQWQGREPELARNVDAIERFHRAPERRDFETMPVYAGQGVGLLGGQRRPVADVVAEFARAADLLRAAGARVRGAGRPEARL